MTGRIASMTVAALTLVSACSINERDKPLTEADIIDVTTTVAEVETTQGATTTAVTEDTLARESKLAIKKCLEATGDLMPLDLLLGGAEEVDKAADTCKEAEQNVDVDASGQGTPSRKLVVALSFRVVLLREALLAEAQGIYDEPAAEKLLADLRQNAVSINANLAQLG